MNSGVSALFLSVAVTAPSLHMIQNIANNWETASSKINLLATELIKGLSKVILVFSTGYIVGSLSKDFSIGLGAVLGLTVMQFVIGWISNLRKGSHKPPMPIHPTSSELIIQPNDLVSGSEKTLIA